jgi:hypothetical protein
MAVAVVAVVSAVMAVLDDTKTLQFPVDAPVNKLALPALARTIASPP